MKLAIIGSRGIKNISLHEYLPEGITEIVSGGAIGVDRLARAYAREQGLLLTEFLPDYQSYGRRAPLLRNNYIIDHADEVVAFWDGKSSGTGYVIDRCQKIGKKVTVFTFSDDKLVEKTVWNSVKLF